MVSDKEKSLKARKRWALLRSVVLLSLGDFLRKKRENQDYAFFGYNTLVWVKDEHEGYIPAKVESTFERGQTGNVLLGKRDEDGSWVYNEPLSISAEESASLLRLDPDDLTAQDNLLALKDLNHASILESLRQRFMQDIIYTYVGDVLVSVNPFKQLETCTSREIMKKYEQDDVSNLPPHIYALANRTFSALGNKNQSCIISGESGAGKTETTRLFLRYLTDVSEYDQAEGNHLRERILQSSLIFESFGNASTVHNKNSSRFGKFIKVNYEKVSEKGKKEFYEISGASVTNYLLEKSRVVGQVDGERNFHIFYQLLAGAREDKTLRDDLKILGESTTHKIMKGKVTNNDLNDWKTLVQAMNSFDVSADFLKELLKIVSAIICLGDIVFEASDNDSSRFSASSKHLVTSVGQLLDIEESHIEKSLLFRQISVGSEKISKPRSVIDAEASRDVISKTAYNFLFEYILLIINEKLDTSDASNRFIGVLDIFGFESFATNSFEQLCINYCNEKLHFFFNQHLFGLEIAEYKKQRLDVSKIKSQNNQPCLQLLEAGRKEQGIFYMIDDHNKLAHATDELLCKNICAQHKNNDAFVAPDSKQLLKAKKPEFSILHYAGIVCYDASNFLMKNKDHIHEDVHATFSQTKNKFLEKILVPEMILKEEKKSKTIGSKFKNQLNLLVDLMESTSPHFVRCIKPNTSLMSGIFTSQMVLRQLSYAGLLEVCIIRKHGYPVRLAVKHFLNRYKLLAKEGVGEEAKDINDIYELTKTLQVMGLLNSSRYQIGNPEEEIEEEAKIFIKDNQYQDLEMAFEISMVSCVSKIQRLYRNHVNEAKENAWTQQLNKLKAYMKSDNIDKDQLLAYVYSTESKYPYGNRILKATKDSFPYEKSYYLAAAHSKYNEILEAEKIALEKARIAAEEEKARIAAEKETARIAAEEEKARIAAAEEEKARIAVAAVAAEEEKARIAVAAVAAAEEKARIAAEEEEKKEKSKTKEAAAAVGAAVAATAAVAAVAASSDGGVVTESSSTSTTLNSNENGVKHGLQKQPSLDMNTMSEAEYLALKNEKLEGLEVACIEFRNFANWNGSEGNEKIVKKLNELKVAMDELERVDPYETKLIFAKSLARAISLKTTSAIEPGNVVIQSDGSSKSFRTDSISSKDSNNTKSNKKMMSFKNIFGKKKDKPSDVPVAGSNTIIVEEENGQNDNAGEVLGEDERNEMLNDDSFKSTVYDFDSFTTNKPPTSASESSEYKSLKEKASNQSNLPEKLTTQTSNIQWATKLQPGHTLSEQHSSVVEEPEAPEKQKKLKKRITKLLKKMI